MCEEKAERKKKKHLNTAMTNSVLNNLCISAFHQFFVVLAFILIMSDVKNEF